MLSIDMNECCILSNDVLVKDFMFCYNLYIYVIIFNMIWWFENVIENKIDLLLVIRDLFFSLYFK